MRRHAGLITLLAALLTFTGAAVAQRYGGEAAAGGAGVTIIGLIVAAIMVVAMWKLFTKAGKPGWAAIIPIYNIIVMLQIAGKPEWWIILMLIPFVNIIAGIMVVVALAESFGKGAGYAVGMILLPFIFYPMLAFGDAQYQG